MRVVTKRQTKEFKNGKFCVAWEYSTGDKDINAAVIDLTGRYPEEGCVVNRVCKEIIHVIKGSGTLTVDGQEIALVEGDQVLVEPNEKYFFDGKMTFVVPCAPAWYPKQHEHVAL